ncbi:MAG TPA: cytochrome D1 domain-containing protein [Candidatus Dormibacteraeota bacterium]|nr:cytochrome D1 domain-containing protein [Candidatus Dormibacteraeota bacterium]
MMSLKITKFRKYSTIIIFCIFCTIGTALKAAETPPASLLALSKGEQSLSIVDPATLTVVARVPAGPDPHEVIASADGKFAFISNYGGGSYNTITVVDLLAQKALPIIDLGALRGPHGLAFVGGKLWFTAEGSKAVGSYDPATKQIDWILGTGQDRTHMIYVFPNLNPIVTSNVNSATVTVIEKADSSAGPPLPPGAPPRAAPRTNWTETVIPVGKGSEGFDVSPDGKEIWVANAQDGTVSVIDLATKKVVQTLNVNVRGANRLKFTPDGKLVFVSTLGGPDLVVLDGSTRKEVKRVPIGHGAAGILMQPDGQRAYVACTPDDYIVVIDLKSLAVTGKITAGTHPDGLAWAVRK